MQISTDIDTTCINTIRTLSMDAVQAANSGHPGTPMALAPVAYCLWQQFLRFDPHDPIWPNRDRFVLSNGHASMLLYSMLASDRGQGGQQGLRNARRACPCRWRTSSISGSSTASARGTRNIAGPAALKPRPARWGRAWPTASAWPSPASGRLLTSTSPVSRLFDFNVYAICGDGCMMEGISGEAASLAGHLKLSNLCWIYDNNHITIEGQHRPGLQRRRRHALHRLRLERHPRRRRQRPEDAGASLPAPSRNATTGRR